MAVTALPSPVGPDPHLPTLEQVIHNLEENGWHYKLASYLYGGRRMYRATVFKPDDLGAGRKVTGRTAAEALSLAFANARKRRYRVAQRLAQRSEQ